MRAIATKERFPNHFPLVPGWDVASGPGDTVLVQGRGPGKVVVLFDP